MSNPWLSIQRTQNVENWIQQKIPEKECRFLLLLMTLQVFEAIYSFLNAELEVLTWNLILISVQLQLSNTIFVIDVLVRWLFLQQADAVRHGDLL